MSQTSNDPYLTSPLKHDRMGPFLRAIVLAALVAAVGLGYWALNRPASTTAHQQVVAEAPAQAVPK